MSAIDGALLLWFALTVPSVLLAAYDLIVRTPAMTVMKWGWLLVIVYTGPVGLVVYLLSCREPLEGTHAEYVAPLWKQAVGSTIHCVAGDATGIILGAIVGILLHLPMTLDLALEYVAGFSFGLFIFQALFMKLTAGGGYLASVRRTIFPEWASMNGLMAGMIPVMMAPMTIVPAAGEPLSLGFWGVMSAAVLVGALTAYPVNVWLVARGLKHGMGTVEVLGRGGHSAEAERARTGRDGGLTGSRSPGHGQSGAEAARPLPRRHEMVVVALVTVVALGAGLWVAGRLGHLTF